jgi:hypothetical protein
LTLTRVLASGFLREGAELLEANGDSGTQMGEEGVVGTSKRATAKDDGTDGAGGLFVGDVDVAAR